MREGAENEQRRIAARALRQNLRNPLPVLPETLPIQDHRHGGLRPYHDVGRSSGHGLGEGKQPFEVPRSKVARPFLALRNVGLNELDHGARLGFLRRAGAAGCQFPGSNIGGSRDQNA